MSGAQRPSDTFDVHNVLNAKISDTGAVMLGVGDERGEDSRDERVVLMQASGIVSIPPIGAEIVTLETSTGFIGIASRDIRTGAIAGNMRAGETTVYAPGSQACSLYKNDGSVTHLTTSDGTTTGQSVYSRVASDTFLFFAPWGKQTFDGTGWHVFTHAGARLDMGGIGGMPAPLDTLGSYAKLSAKMVYIEGSIVALGPRGGVADSAAKATPTVLALNAISTLITALGTPGAFISPPSGGPCTAGPALVTAIATTISALTAAQTTIPSNSVTVT